MRVPPLPQLWALLAAAKPTSAVRRSKAKLKTKGAKVARPGNLRKWWKTGGFLWENHPKIMENTI